MKIAVVTDAWFPQINGVVNSLYNTTEILAAWGDVVTVISPDQFRTVPCPTYPEIPLAWEFWSVGKKLDAFDPDAVHIATEGPLGLAARYWCVANSYPFTTAYMTRFPEYIYMRFRIPTGFSLGYFQWFHQASAAVMVSTESLERELDARGFKNLKRWSRGVDTDTFTPAARREGNNLRPVFLYVGRVALEKNIEAFLSLDLPGSKMVTGDGPDLERLRAKWPEVTFTGAKKGKELAAVYASADVFVFPSLTDTFGIVMLEAAASGLPVAAFPVQGPSDVVIHGKTGFLHDDLGVACLEALCMNRESCRRHALTRSWEVCTRQFLDNLSPKPGRDARNLVRVV